MLTIAPLYEGIELPPAYEGYIRERNTNLARAMGRGTGMPFAEEAHSPLKPFYPLLPQAHLRQDFHTEDPMRFYGALVDHLMHGTKGLLKNAIRPDTVPCHLPQDREALSAITLPGYVAFNEDQALEAFHELRRSGYEHVRLKDPNESDANGQYLLHSEAELRHLLGRYGARFHDEIGMVLEANLEHPKTSSAGEILLPDGRRLSFIGRQRDLRDRAGFAGMDMVVAHRPLSHLAEAIGRTQPELLLGVKPAALTEAIERTRELMRASRLSFDIIGGQVDGGLISGIADITTRVGGTCPGLMESLKVMRREGIECMNASVVLTYGGGEMPDFNQDSIRATYLNQPALRIDTAVTPNRMRFAHDSVA